ncbi:uncharacterized protein LOC128239264 [Mya arenaria]|uniref:uncharacterized protein LOC128239264 n=1 Tax=Mya arenaria TaxID=6604 RepID=UPI0022E00AEB|nr:uncharacterized protein LOC128239264 [Mya arenaria]
MIDTSKGRGQRYEHSRRSTTQKEGEKIPSTSYPATKTVVVIQATQKIKTFTTNTVPEPSLNPSGTQTSAKPKQKTQNIVSNDLTRLKFTSAPEILVRPPSEFRNCWLNDILLLSGDRLLLNDISTRTLKIIDLKTSSLTSEVNVPGMPWGMCHIPGDKVAICVSQSIQFLEKRGKLFLGKNIKVDSDCRGVGYHNGNLIISFESGNVQKINMEGKVLATISTSSFKNPWHLKVVGDDQTAAIYVSDFEMCTITKLDMNLITLETFKDPALRKPLGITAVGNQLIICGWLSHNIMCLDLQSGNMTELLGMVEGIASPKIVCYSLQQNKMYVAVFENGDANNYVKVYNTTPKWN